MKISKVNCLLIFILISLSNYTFSEVDLLLPESIIIVTSDKAPINNIVNWRNILKAKSKKIEFYNFDKVKQFEEKLSEGLPNNESDARKAIDKKIKNIGKESLMRDLQNAYRGVATAIKYQLNRYPIIIFDKQYAVYGVIDLSVALKKYNDFIKRENNNG